MPIDIPPLPELPSHTCEHAGCTANSSNSTLYRYRTTDGDVHVCRAHRPARTFTCYICSERFHTSHENMFDGISGPVCGPCADTYVRCCDNCDGHYSSASYSSCPHCSSDSESSEQEDEGPIMTYDSRVTTVPVGRGPVFSGVELEVEAKQGYSREGLARSVHELFDDFILIKNDGSLENGFEIVTRPASLEEQKKNWEPFFEKRPKGMSSWENGRCGMHIHMTRYGNDGKSIMSDMTVAKMVMFVNAPRNKKFVTDIAGRESERWSKIIDKGTLPKALHIKDRYEAVNLTNSKTIEFRIFKGTLAATGFFKNLEFCFALKDFCWQGNQSLIDCQSHEKFTEFVAKRKGEFPYLYKFLNNK